MPADDSQRSAHRVSVVIPVYQGERTLGPLVEELAALTTEQPAGTRRFCITEVILVHDCAIDDSARVMQELAIKHAFIKTVWLSRNFGQHPATLAGMAATSAPWVATLDEDGQQCPADIEKLLKRALETDAQLVYGEPTNTPRHGIFRNALSTMVHWIFSHILGNRHIGSFSSFRLIDGEIARSLAAYCGQSVFLDVALSWVVASAEHTPIELRTEEVRPSGYSFRSLSAHFWRLLITSGTKPLRIISTLGMLAIIVACGLTVYALWMKVLHRVPVPGWTSLVVVVSFFSGVTLFSLGIIAEYLAVAVGILMGKPLYLTTSRPRRAPRRR